MSKFNFNFNPSTFKTSNTDSSKSSTATDSSKSTTATDSSKSTKSDSSKSTNSDTPMHFDFKGFSFDTTMKDTKKKDQPAPKKFGLTNSGNSIYDNFLKEMRSSGKNSLNQKNSTTNPPKLAKKKEDLFEVHYVPISGVHFDRIFIQKESVSKASDDQEIGESFNQPTHVSRTYEEMYK